MSANQRLKLVMIVALVLIVAVSAAALLGMISLSTSVWIGAAVGVFALVAAKFHRHAELPDSVKLH